MRSGSVVVFVLGFALFALMAAPGLTWMDPGELAQAAYNLGGAHPPGHPAHSLVGKLATLVPIGEIAFRLNLLSALAMAGALAGVFALARALLADEVVAGALAVGLAALSPVLQINAVRTEVYAPVAALLVWSMVAVLRFVRQTRGGARAPDGSPDGDGPRGDLRLLLLAALGIGLTAGFHPVIAASAGLPMALAGLSALWPARSRIPRLIGLAAGLALFGAMLYLYLPVRAHAATPPLLLWGDPEGVDGMIALVTGSAYRGNFEPGGMLGRFAELLVLAGDGPGVGLVWGGLVGLLFAALTGLRGAGWLLVTALVIVLGAATQARTNPDMPGYILVALLFLAAGLAPLAGALVRLGSSLLQSFDRLRGAAWPRHLLAAVFLAPLVGFALTAPAGHSRAHGDSGFQRHDDPLRLWSDTVDRMAPGPGVYFASSDHTLFAAQYERLVAGQRPDIAVANPELARDRWFLAHIDRLLPVLAVPYIDDGVAGSTAERLAFDNLTRGAPVAGDDPAVGRLDPSGSVPMGRAYRYTPPESRAPRLRPGSESGPESDSDSVSPPPRLSGALGQKIARRIGLTRARHEIVRGRLASAAIAAGLRQRFDDAAWSRIAAARPSRSRPALAPLIPAMTPVFISAAWQADLMASELVWMASAPDPASDAISRQASAHVTPEQRLHALWRDLLTRIPGESSHGEPDSSGGVSPAAQPADLFDAIGHLGRDAEMATARMLVAIGRDRLAESSLRWVMARRGRDEKNLVLLGSILGNRNTIGALAEAEALFAEAAQLAPDDPEPLVRLGLAQRKQGKIALARESWQRALMLDPGRRDAAMFLRAEHRKDGSRPPDSPSDPATPGAR